MYSWKSSRRYKRATKEGNRKYGCWDIVKEFAAERKDPSPRSSSDLD
jgi:hypothetical protein